MILLYRHGPVQRYPVIKVVTLADGLAAYPPLLLTGQRQHHVRRLVLDFSTFLNLDR